jgi:uncharacterized protein
MLLDLSRLREPRERFDWTFEPSAFDPRGEEFAVRDRVSLTVEVFKDGARYRLVGRVQTTLLLTCSRCLEQYAAPVDAPFDLVYLPFTQNVGEGEFEVREDDLSTAYYRDELIDLGELMREQFYLALPMKPLCAPACRGLCPVCGTNLNLAPCGCRAEWVDPRLAVLEALVKRES